MRTIAPYTSNSLGRAFVSGEKFSEALIHGMVVRAWIST
jgi:hypothetical protein